MFFYFYFYLFLFFYLLVRFEVGVEGSVPFFF